MTADLLEVSLVQYFQCLSPAWEVRDWSTVRKFHRLVNHCGGCCEIISCILRTAGTTPRAEERCKIVGKIDSTSSPAAVYKPCGPGGLKNSWAKVDLLNYCNKIR